MIFDFPLDFLDFLFFLIDPIYEMLVLELGLYDFSSLLPLLFGHVFFEVLLLLLNLPGLVELIELFFCLEVHFLHGILFVHHFDQEYINI